ncbi:MAG TPA: TOPRIM nucleotidyl transferase/hydrolase domain-containing protein [Galbitalea sp.]|jgi:hypothetical protein
MQTVLLVEGNSDRIAIESLARRRGQDLDGVRVVSLGGVTNASKAIAEFGPAGANLRLAGLCDIGEERYFRGALERAGIVAGPGRADLEELGFFVCVRDLEDELIRSLEVEGTERVLEREGDLAAFRVFQNQPFHRGRAPEQQLHRFFGTIGGRKARYAEALTAGVELERAPGPLVGVLDFVT